MKCLYCNSNMKCVNDVSDISVRIDWFECNDCNGKCEVIYSVSSRKRVKKTWTHEFVEVFE